MKIATFIIFISLFFSNLYSLDTYCDICNEKIISEYYIDAWGNKFHATHKENGVFCNTCSRIISKQLTSGGFQFNDGRHMCKLCSIAMINSDHLKIKSINNVLDMLKVINIPIDDKFISINLVDRISLQKSIENNPDPIYGKGYKYMNSLLEIHGWDKLISMLLGNN